MSSLRDFVQSAFSDAMLPAFRQTFEDVVFETLNDRKVPSRTDFLELRDLVNRLRGQASSAQSGNKKLDKRLSELEEQIAGLEARLAERDAAVAGLSAALAALEARVGAGEAKPAPRKRAPRKKPPAKKPPAKAAAKD
jgi:chromosome segregation ATPase